VGWSSVRGARGRFGIPPATRSPGRPPWESQPPEGAGYEDHGTPGERAVYHPGYYGAFVLDPDGHNVEVVNHNS
jgi:catechol 2,3-dioxygenase-like lactoylglutathione lyase family enzyme